MTCFFTNIQKQLNVLKNSLEQNNRTNDKANDKADDEQPDTTDVSDIEGEESAEQKTQKGKWLKILTSNQILSRLSTTLAQLKSGNNSEKLKNEMKQLLYYLYHSRKLTKTIYNNLINII